MVAGPDHHVALIEAAARGGKPGAGKGVTLPAGMTDLLSKALKKDPSERFQTVAEFGGALETALGFASR